MGKTIFDQFSILHMASGVIAYFWGISFKAWFILHAIFEIIENTKKGIYVIDNYITMWPGGKNEPDTITNSISDQIFGMIGWYIAFYLDKKFKNN